MKSNTLLMVAGILMLAGWAGATDYNYVGPNDTRITDNSVAKLTALSSKAAGPYTITFNPNSGVVNPKTATTDDNGFLGGLPEPTRSGYTFDGWYNSSGGGAQIDLTKAFTANTTIYAHWTIVKYTIIFDANGGTVSPEFGTTGNGWKLSSLPTPTRRPGYTFGGWYTLETGGAPVNTGTVFNESTVIYAHWTPIRYSISYALGGGTVTPANPTNYTIETAGFALNNPTRTAYTFDGWTPSGTTDKQLTAYVEAGSTGDKSFTANWTLEIYTITFDPRGGTVSPTTGRTGGGGKLSSLPTPSSRAGYSFDGWYSADAGGDAKVSTSTVFGGDATVYARWTPTNYSITYNLNGGTVTPPNPTSYNIENAGFSLNQPVKVAYTFDGWTGSNGTEKQTDVYVEFESTGNKSYTANYTLNNYTVTFDANGGAVSPTTARTGAGGKLTSLPTPTRTGYAFDGWYTDISGGTKVTTASSVFGEDATVYALWTPIYTVTFNGNGGTVSVYSATTGTGGKLGSMPEEPTRDGYDFNGWYTDRAGGSRVTSSTVFAENKEVYAQWKVSVAVSSPSREIPGGAPVEGAAVAPVKASSGGLTVGPNPAKVGGTVSLYWGGGKAVSGELGVFDALGARVGAVAVSPSTTLSPSTPLRDRGAKQIGVWKVGNVAEGTYVIKGVLTDKDGVSVKVSVPVGVTR
jgi:uncharacterized repeat protein (TIGR02543 family)